MTKSRLVLPRRIVGTAFASLVLALLAGCAPADLVNAMVPEDGWRAERGIAYGPHPRQRLDLYRPDPPRAAAPVVVFLYGGSWRSGDRGRYLFVGEALASMGYVAVIPDYRLYPPARYPAFVDDAAKAVRWSVDHAASHGGDPRHVVLMGHSAGAFNAALTATDPRFLGAEGLSPAVLDGVVGLAGPYDIDVRRWPRVRAVFGGVDDPDTVRPTALAGAGTPPMLLLHGADDGTVSPANSKAMAASLRAAGTAATLHVYDGLDHYTLIGALAAPLRGASPVYGDVAAFIRRVTGAAAGARQSAEAPLPDAARRL